MGAIAGGIAGGVAAISVLAVTLLFYFRRRRSKATSAPFIIDDSVSNPRMDQAQWSMSGQETVTSLPGTSASMMKHYVHVSIPPAPLVCAHVFSLFF